MNITRENTGDLTATVKIAITSEDYEEKVTKLLKDYQRKAKIPGFRPGHVPFGMINKMYGKAILADEINKLISDSINKYIEDEKLVILGNPIPNRDKNTMLDFDHQTNFDFYFNLGFAPEIHVDLNTVEVEKYLITADDQLVDRYVDSIRERHGTIAPDEVGMSEGDEVTKFESEEVRESGSEEVIKSEGEEGEEKTIEKPKSEPKKILAELTPELFDKVYPGMNIETEEDFREQIRKEAAASFTGESDKIFFRQVSDKLVKESTFQLPDEFLKQWLLETNEGKYTQKEIEEQYPVFNASMRWQLIENKILKDYQIAVKDEDIRNYVKEYYLKNIPMTLVDPEMEKRYDSLIDTVMENKEQVRKINDELYTNNLLEVFKSTLKIENKDISYEDFLKVATTLYGHSKSPEPDHEHTHEHGHEHEHEHQHDHEHDHEHEHEHDHQHDYDDDNKH